MYEDLRLYKCGECGGVNYNIYQEEGNDTRVVTVCTGCNAQSEIVIIPAKLDVKEGKNGNGVMTIFS